MGWYSTDSTEYIVEVNRGGFRSRASWTEEYRDECRANALAVADKLLQEATLKHEEIEIVISTKESYNM